MPSFGKTRNAPSTSNLQIRHLDKDAGPSTFLTGLKDDFQTVPKTSNNASRVRQSPPPIVLHSAYKLSQSFDSIDDVQRQKHKIERLLENKTKQMFDRESRNEERMKEGEKNYREFLKRKKEERKEQHQKYTDLMALIAEKNGKVRETHRMMDVKARNAYLQMIKEERNLRRRKELEAFEQSPKQYRENARKLSLQIKREEATLLNQTQEYESLRQELRQVEEKVLGGYARSVSHKLQASLKFKSMCSQSFSRVDEHKSTQQQEDLERNSKRLESIAGRFKKANERLKNMS